ncbi:glycosyltransferase [Limosilactobacillus vaginalis]|uniref:glycosyltransferase n=1 Tax=Limosilactobacillus vaginalis TaxID=1633 RepID=UPI0025A47FA1|nr:glycosyltransferase [Limosilactobacillus vaginalis]MDM8261393.1 glycosyltransferase [Limosilactobacillus vaginalis]
MKILIYSLGLPPFRRGGLVNYSVDLAEQLAREDNEVTFLYPGKMPLKRSNSLSFKKRKVNYHFQCYEMINPLPVSLTFGNSTDVLPFFAKRDKSKIRSFIKKISPDVVHIHTIMGLPKEYLEILKEENIKTVFTTHDYYGLCPKMITSNPLERLKSSECSYDCMLCSVGPNLTKIRLMQSHLYQTFKELRIVKYFREKQRKKVTESPNIYHFGDQQAMQRYQLREYYLQMFRLIDCYHFNSSVSESIYKKYFPNINGKILPITEKGLQRRNSKKEVTDHVTIGFLGGVSAKKGFKQIKQVTTSLFRQGLDFKVLCAGSESDDIFFKKENVNNLGIISHSEVNNFYHQIDLLVVPSQWHETFGLVVLEALANNIPVFCSDMVGAKDILPSDLIFHSKNELVKKLTDYIKFLNYRKQVSMEIQHLDTNFDFSKHVRNVLDTFY